MRNLVPEDVDLNGRPRAATYLERAVIANVLATGRFEPPPEVVARRLWGDDGVTGLVLRGAVEPALTTAPTWAGTLARDAVGDFVSSLAPLSAGAQLLNAAPRVSLKGVDSVSFPQRISPLRVEDVPWVAEGGAIRVPKLTIGGGKLGPARKLAAIVVATSELRKSSAVDIVLITQLRESTAFSLDASLFSNAAATAERPAGILDGIAPLTAATGGDDAAIGADLSALAGAIGTVTTGLAIVAHPAQAHAIKLRRGGTFPADVPVWPTLGVSAGTIIALDPAAFASGFGPEPEIKEETDALMHMEDTTAGQVSTPGSPNTVAAALRSLFQTECVAVRLILRCAWAWRVPGAVAWISGTTW